MIPLITVKLPWALDLVTGHKTAEHRYRDLVCEYTGPCLIHASNGYDKDLIKWRIDNLRGCILGLVYVLPGYKPQGGKGVVYDMKKPFQLTFDPLPKCKGEISLFWLPETEGQKAAHAEAVKRISRYINLDTYHA